MQYKAKIIPVMAVITAVFAGSMAAEARVCKRDRISATGNWHLTQVAARASARVAWKRAARSVHGNRFDTWLRATNRRYVCTKAGVRDRCRAVATPCRR